MKNTFTLDSSTVAFVGAVHAIGGVGIGMWLSRHVPLRRRRTIALALVVAGAMLHVPMRRAVMRGRDANGHSLGA